jgi:hypothetical protein
MATKATARRYYVAGDAFVRSARGATVLAHGCEAGLGPACTRLGKLVVADEEISDNTPRWLLHVVCSACARQLGLE